LFFSANRRGKAFSTFFALCHYDFHIPSGDLLTFYCENIIEYIIHPPVNNIKDF